MASNLPPAFHRDDLTFNGRLYTPLPLSNPLVRAARHAPQDIDALLQPCLYSPDLPYELGRLMRDYVSTLTTPGLYGGGIRSRPRWFYANCAVFGMLLGRAFALLSTPTRPPQSLDSPKDFPFMQLPAELRFQIYGYYNEDLAQRQRYWEVMSQIFVKALWSGIDAEEGSRYTTGIIVLSCGHAMSQTATLLRGHGSSWVWWDDDLQNPEETWSWAELRAAIIATKDLPRDNTDVLALQAQNVTLSHSEGPWYHHFVHSRYVSLETLEILDLAREHLQAGERDWTPPEIEARLLSGLFDYDEARGIWKDTGLVPRAFESKFASERNAEPERTLMDPQQEVNPFGSQAPDDGNEV